jgi:CBS domain-containing protein
MEKLKVKDAMTHLVVTLRPEETILDAAKRLLSNRISGAPVVVGGRLVGVVSEVDLVKALLPSSRGDLVAVPSPLMFLLLRGSPPHETRFSFVGDVMTKNVVTIGQDESLLEAASKIDRYGVRRLPVVDQEGFVVGVVARSDLVRCMARSHEARRAS